MFFIVTWLRDKNNPIYVAPAMNSPVKRLERPLKDKQLLKLTGDIVGMERKWWHVDTAARFPARKGGVRIRWKIQKGGKVY